MVADPSALQASVVKVVLGTVARIAWDRNAAAFFTAFWMVAELAKLFIVCTIAATVGLMLPILPLVDRLGAKPAGWAPTPRAEATANCALAKACVSDKAAVAEAACVGVVNTMLGPPGAGPGPGPGMTGPPGFSVVTDPPPPPLWQATAIITITMKITNTANHFFIRDLLRTQHSLK